MVFWELKRRYRFHINRIKISHRFGRVRFNNRNLSSTWMYRPWVSNLLENRRLMSKWCRWTLTISTKLEMNWMINPIGCQRLNQWNLWWEWYPMSRLNSIIKRNKTSYSLFWTPTNMVWSLPWNQQRRLCKKIRGCQPNSYNCLFSAPASINSSRKKPQRLTKSTMTSAWCMKADMRIHLKMIKVDSRQLKVALNFRCRRCLNLTCLSRGWSLKLMQTTFSIICRCSSVYNKSFFTHRPQHQIWRVPVPKISRVIITWKLIQTKTMEIITIIGTFRWIRQCGVRWSGWSVKTTSKWIRACRSWWNRGTWSHHSTFLHSNVTGETRNQPTRSLNTLEGWSVKTSTRNSQTPSGSSWPRLYPFSSSRSQWSRRS